jgi:hypothetical protein
MTSMNGPLFDVWVRLSENETIMTKFSVVPIDRFIESVEQLPVRFEDESYTNLPQMLRDLADWFENGDQQEDL